MTIYNCKDLCWSAQDMRQINGRIHRQPQDKTVHVIHLIADGTSDVLMYAMATGKKAMLEAFVKRNPDSKGKITKYVV
jgi:SNF2 family DNA or RNA helicase